MGRELQKRKNRSSIPKARPKPPSKKRILQNPVIAQNWDKSQTLTQNYRRLGLTRRLNKSTGGVEKKVSDIEAGGARGDGLNLSSKGSGKQMLEIREAKIERDPETGRIVRVFEGSGGRGNPLGDPLNGFISDSEDEAAEAAFDEHGTNVHPDNTTQPKTAVVGQLQREARRPAAKYKRRQPEGERVFVEALVRKYGDDYGRMARDMEINYMQRSEGDLKRRVKRWREQGGTVER